MLGANQESRFEYKGFPCVVLFLSNAYRCGYVGIPKSNKYYDKNYGEIPVSCHGGLTYSAKKLFGQNDTDTWWIGFDCAHYGDGYDVKKAKELFANDEQVMKQLTVLEQTGYFSVCEEDQVRTLDYVEENCRSIVDQLIQLESKER